MKKVLKKLPLIVLVLVLVLAIEDKTYAATYGKLTYEVQDDGTIEITDCSESASGALTIPSTIDGKKVTGIGWGAFEDCRNLTSITIPNSVISIESRAFHYCSSLTSITIPESVTSIGEDIVFYGCSSLTSINVSENNKNYCSVDGVLINKDKTRLIQYPIKKEGTSYKIPNSVTSIGDWAFYECSSLKNITIPNSVTSIGSDAFYNCSSLTSITIPESVTSIGDNAFWGCSSLKSINVSENNKNYCSVDGVLINKDKTRLIQYPIKKEGTSYKIPNSVTSIGDWAFYECSSLKNITIPNSVTSIGSDAFYNCSSLTSITIPEGVTSIGDYTFFNCSSLTSIIIPESVKSIGGNAFDRCRSLTSITIPDSVTSIGSDAFYNCSSLTSITIPDSVTSIGDRVFSSCSSLTNITIPNSVTSIGSDAFYNCSSLTSITIPESVTSIGDNAFEDCSSLTSITIPNSVTSIGNGAFGGCSSLTNITIPDGVTSIGGDAFKYCRSLTSINVLDNNKNYSSIDGVLFNKDKTKIVKYPEGKKGISYDIPNGVTSIGWGAFEGCESLTSIIIPESVTSIGDSAFRGCESLTSITIPESVTSIGDSAFRGCESLTSIIIPESVTSIGDSAFFHCSSLTSIIIPKSVTSIGDSAFRGCESLTSIIIPESVTSIGNRAFFYCSNLEKVLCLGNASKLGSETFDYCSSNLKIYAKNGLTGYETNGWEKYGDKIVRYDESLKKITFTSRKQTEKIELSNDAFKEIASIKSYEIEDKSIVSVDSSGNVTPLKNGTTNVKAVVQYFDGTKVNLTEKIVVNVKSTGVAIKPSTWSFVDKYQSPTKKMAAKVQPVDTAFQDVTWKSSNTSIATVDKDGNVTAVGNGTCKIIATTTDGYNKSGSSDVTVDIKAESINLDKTSLDITNMGVKEKVKADVSPSFSTINRPVKWSSSDTNVAKVDNDGNVTPVGNGACKITATTADGTNLSASCDVTVKVATGISLNVTSYKITNVSQTLALVASLKPDDLENKKVEWRSSNTGIATVDENGNVTPVGSGSCKITATTTDGTNLSASFNITVNIKATKITLDKTKIELTTGKEIEKITSSIEPSIANKNVKYTSSDESIATVSSDGVVTAVGSGTCKITATTTDGSKVTASCDVTVDIKTTGMKLDKTNYTFNKAETIKINPVITPSKASKKLTWTSSNTKVAIVSNDGKVTPVGKGTCKITATTTDGTNLSSSCNITSNVEYQKGDVNRDGKVNTLDVYYAMKGIVNGTLTDEEKVILDVNGDSKANTLDINIIMRYIVGQIDSL